MAFRKYIRRRVRRVKANTWYGKRYFSRQGMGRLIKDVRYLKGQLNTELKYIDGTQTTPTVIPSVAVTNGNWQLYRLNSVTQGDLTQQRHGASVKFKSIQIKGDIERLAGNHRVRMVLFIDKEPLTTGLGTVNNVPYRDMYTLSSGIGQIDAMRNFNGILSRRFKVLYDRTFLADADDIQRSFSIYKKLNMSTKWQIDSIAGDQQITNVLYLAFMTDDPAGTATQSTFHHRMTYIDN